MNDNFPPLDQVSPVDVLDFWFADGSRAHWWEASDTFDDLIRSQFAELWEQACAGHLDNWADRPDGALALIILLDQFSRNLNRRSARAFAQDDKARSIARSTIANGLDMEIERERRQFIYMPFEHSEDLQDQITALAYMRERVGEPSAILFAEKHLEVIEKFGRFPHRNKALGRESTMAELAWLDQGGGF